jgi:hypothetical protein
LIENNPVRLKGADLGYLVGVADEVSQLIEKGREKTQ